MNIDNVCRVRHSGSGLSRTALPCYSPQRGLLHMRRAGIPVEGHQDARFGQQLGVHSRVRGLPIPPLLLLRRT